MSGGNDYEYAPFGEVTAQVRRGGVTAYDFAALNPWRFSSEYADDALNLDYYNYRHYEPVTGRWLSRDPMISRNEYVFLNNLFLHFDVLGLATAKWGETIAVAQFTWEIESYIDVIPKCQLCQEPYVSILKDDLRHFDEYIRYVKGISNTEYLKHCPCNITDARQEDGWTRPMKTHHIGGDMEVRREFPDGATFLGRRGGQQCVYDKCGKLINKGKSAGTPDDYSYRADDGAYEMALHILTDAKAYIAGKTLDAISSCAGRNTDFATELDHLFSPPDIGMDIDGSPCPENYGERQ